MGNFLSLRYLDGSFLTTSMYNADDLRQFHESMFPLFRNLWLFHAIGLLVYLVNFG
jgi:hypothetical protein